MRKNADSIEHFSNRLQRIRTEQGLTQGELARRSGITRQAVSSIEANTYLPTTAVALRLAAALQCRVEDLFSLAEAEPMLEGRLVAGEGTPQCQSGPIRVKVATVAGNTIVRTVS